MELPESREEPVLRVATRNSTKTQADRRKSRKEKRRSGRLQPESILSDSDHSVRVEHQPSVVEVEKGVAAQVLPMDISQEVRKALESPIEKPQTGSKRVAFSDTPVFIKPEIKVDEYDIVQDIKNQQANATIGQLLHDNINYQKIIREAWSQKRKRRLKLPSVAVNFSQVEDYGAPELEVEVEGCIVPGVPIDGGSGVNLMLEDTAFDLGYTSFQATDQVLRMADQSRVHPVGRLSQIPTRIGKETYLLNYVVIRVNKGRPFPMLLGRPWLYSARVLVDWGAKEFVVGRPAIRIP